MSGGKRDETAEREGKPGSSLPELVVSIGKVLRRAAGLPSQENPLIAGSDEAHLPQLDRVSADVYLASRATEWHNPRAVEDELGAIRRELKRLKNRIAALDENTIRQINDTEGVDIDGVRFTAEFLLFTPVEERTVPVTLAAMERLEVAIVQVIEQTIDAGNQLPATGRIPNLAARNVAYLVAKYLRDVTGKTPALWTGATPSGPFEMALTEIFEILDVESGLQRPGEWAIKELTSKPSENSVF